MRNAEPKNFCYLKIDQIATNVDLNIFKIEIYTSILYQYGRNLQIASYRGLADGKKLGEDINIQIHVDTMYM